ncbi:radical SAM protein [Candidatus Woesearchaeota archaeon]|nr:radical SAM protein [Candidatus Woesearchaeota archaeon]
MMLIYLCDLVHNFLGTGTYMFPLNIGYIAAWSKKKFGDSVEVRLFKYPKDFMEAFSKRPADMVGFSNYTWNADINMRVAAWVKSKSPNSVVVYGGPNINYTEKGYKKFFDSHPSVDFYVPYQGEVPFENLLRVLLNSPSDVSRPIEGVISHINGNIIVGTKIARIKNMEEVPSPYLTGLMDEFFEANLIPIVESNRGCSFTCTYCCQCIASYNQMEFFDIERVKKELDYIAERAKKTNILIFADSNFGMLPRDVEIARHISELMKKTGYPRRVSMNWAKNQPRLYEIAKILNNINVIISLQSLDDTVLQNVRRHNIQISVFKDIIDRVNHEGGISGTEIILALPGETKESHLNSLRMLFDWDVSYIICYNCLVLEGSEMSMKRESNEFRCATKFRLIDNSFGQYDGIVSFEAEEGIRELPTMSETDILYFRPIHWLIQFMWNYRFYYDFLKYLQSLGINPLDFITRMTESADSKAPEKLKNIFRQFSIDARQEWFDSPEQLRSHYSKPENLQWLKDGNYGKMNGQYIFRVLLEARKEFEDYMYLVATENFPACRENASAIRDILNFMSESIIDFSEEDVFQDRNVSCKYDLMAWRKSGYDGLEKFRRDVSVHLYSPKEQKEALGILLKQYRHKNMLVTLRKMSEYMDIRDFFRKAAYEEEIKTVM